MEWIYKPFSYTAVIVAVGFLIKYLIQKKIDSYFNTKLEDHKKELAVMTEKAKYDISRKLFDFEAYATKKHIVYPELYQHVFSRYTEIAEFLIKTQVKYSWSSDTIHDLTKLSEEKTAELLSEFTHVLKNSRQSLQYFAENELFLSQEISSQTQEIFGNLQTLAAGLFVDPVYDKPAIWREMKIIQLKMRRLKKEFHKELSYSHFEETEEKA
ncbi:hypothetical protein ACFQ9Y_16945 [Peribacillus simplex]|uniref:hypothetical protein n=1 Tax=Peribacillus simplex TaxID=1478 RepID=UPI0036724716